MHIDRPHNRQLPVAYRLVVAWQGRMLLLLVLLVASWQATTAARGIPQPLAGHPGNIFLAGEVITVPLPVGDGTQWTAVDYEGKTVATGESADGKATLGKLGVGYYEVRRVGSQAMTSVGVLAPLQAPTPTTSPIGVDVAMAWFYQESQLDAVANLCALAGMNRVRDRLNWWAMEPKKGELAAANIYDATARTQAAHGLQILQVNHYSPPWANPVASRMPDDLRDAYNFYRAMAARWKGKVTAFEPWNEPEIALFGGHTGVEIAAFQKACYLGLKAGNPAVTVCSPVLATGQQAVVDDLTANDLWAYCDTYNFHHYCGVAAYPNLYAIHRAASMGKPLWVSECNIPVNWSGDPKAQEPTASDLHTQAERLATVYAGSLYENAAATFYFVLPHYSEGSIQYGVLHRDLTPRPVYLALAATGRLLADAHPLGRLQHQRIYGYLFTAVPDGKTSEVLVAWTDGAPETLELPVMPTAVYDLLGRKHQTVSKSLQVTHAPMFVLLPTGSARLLPITAPPSAPKVASAAISSVVLQTVWPAGVSSLNHSAGKITPGQELQLPVFAYNFGKRVAKGTLTVTAPAGWTVHAPPTVTLTPGERQAIPITIQCPAAGEGIAPITITGHFGNAGETRLAIRMSVNREATAQAYREFIPLASSENPARWDTMSSTGSTLTLTAAPNGVAGVQVSARLGDGDRWLYPTFLLPQGETPPEKAAGLQFTLTPVKGKAFYRAMFIERTGSVYVADLVENPEPGKPLRLTALLADASYGAFSPPDPNGKLDLSNLQAIRIGANTQDEAVEYIFSGVGWVR